ncbi:Ref family recombination enhancement nuclease [Enterobacter sp. NFIX58]|uniref:Ref family recombination enhancement nuclease n=1 Tax=Enterobacter sp. NFIX58 TaxID=1566251 RepID=UPI0008D73DCB|nr:Ref family recombination enhancement nuclease [Enterobacter sp. NFIX58]SEO38455.1 Recombination enhancement, RecA-dependent nuclease [Enterobacter sp. NFIX58]
MKKADSLHLSRVAALGCIVCRNHNLGETPAEIHHIRTGQGTSQRADHQKSIPLCHMNHRNGGYGVAIHAGRRTWEMKHGTEAELLVQVLYLLGEGADA